jgi:flavin reductase (DIM6/NTAB) family NADH-FMN oxidoreductase RutF
MTTSPADIEAFETIMGALDTPSYVVTTAADGAMAGCLVGFATRCSIEPPRFGVWLSKVNRTYRIAAEASMLVVHLLRSGDTDLARWFGGETGDDIDKFADLDWQPGPDGCPVIQRLDWFAGSILDRVDTGDHVAFVVAPLTGQVRRTGAEQLQPTQLGDIEAGHPVSDR